MVNKNSKQIKSDIINKSLKTLGNTTKNNKEKKNGKQIVWEEDFVNYNVGDYIAENSEFFYTWNGSTSTETSDKRKPTTAKFHDGTCQVVGCSYKIKGYTKDQ